MHYSHGYKRADKSQGEDSPFLLFSKNKTKSLRIYTHEQQDTLTRMLIVALL
jgi:hypothetical protein